MGLVGLCLCALWRCVRCMLDVWFLLCCPCYVSCFVCVCVFGYMGGTGVRHWLVLWLLPNKKLARDYITGYGVVAMDRGRGVLLSKIACLHLIKIKEKLNEKKSKQSY